ncbi:ABC transporter related [Thermosinus carboxydivorans Nor1]|uniref:ABC transporter related n=1 Tax=Thermosinus carboxydivorans Nor1 TaxID=401526 RepID=A1HSH7_9FIRM|nr:nitrate/sulfonate/bicarbonate ABC transporter ATP-binding protein [Thermosinus carboxydivorans]EAX47039.1 ABC transporter related [Thermosinus carboxydivorans Nor1]
MNKQPLIELKNVQKKWDMGGGNAIPVLASINLSIYAGEFIAILGPSGSGKSTLLRIIAGLTPASSGKVTYLGQEYHGVNPGAAMVFQSFALFPWLTVLENVMLGLEAKAMSDKAKQEKALHVIDMIGLDGFESAYPKELSGGMQQRVGLGRALVSDPDVLLMDEPFSALDVLTAENLRRDILELWRDKKIPTKAIIMVTHGIEEAVYMADRILVVSGSPARINADMPVTLPHWRDKNAPAFVGLVDKLYSLMMKREPADLRKIPLPEDREIAAIPHVSAGALTGFLELLEDLNEKTDLYKLADRFTMDSEDFFPIVEGATLLKFAKVVDGDIELTPEGIRFAQASVLERKELFRTQLVKNVTAVKKILAILQSKSNKRMNIEFFENILARSFPPAEVQSHLDILIDWGRYAELFAYDEQSRQLFLE